ncbi:YhgE/Pip family protein [Vescimonas sanitatis]|uniref:YhgE/Pip domain-containing protein n=1 Tax=Vescimonas sanitatis TaxID=3376993 RepID=UPI003B7DBDFA
MRNIWTVFKTDIRTLSKCFFACVVVVAIALLPSLYAWLNIYSNWDPYGNTGGISIAVASLDEGYTDADGTYENKGDDVVADLREATSINWVIVDTEEEAKGGVESGDYYAAVVVDKQFSRNMYRMLTDWTGKPAITYYENAKKNAVATKITDTAVETLKRSISENYLEVVIDGIMEQSNLLAANLTADDPEAAVKGVLYQAQDLLHACGRMMDAFETAGGSGVSESSAAALEAAVANINKNLPDGAQLQQTAAEIQLRLNTALARVERALDRLNSAIGNAPELPSAQQQLRDAAAQLEKAAATLETWAAGLEASGTEAGKTQAEAARQTAAECRKTAKQLRALAESPDSADLLADCDALVKSLRTMADRIPVTSKALQKELDTVAGQVADTMEGMAALAGDAKAMKTALAETADAVGDTMALLRPATEKLLTSLESTIDDLEGLTTDEYMDTLVDILGGDPAVYGQYFPEMVQTSVNAVYPIANYGSAMTPFYTVLAIWVGGVILSSLIKIHARTEGLIDPKPAELYFGRYLFFFVLSQIQAAVIVTGDLYILKVQCLHPGMLYLTGALTAFTFSLLIYSLALSFGDVGKAIVVVIMVMQIAGSSGTFPIELLPAIYQKIYRFFPFPYAIDAMRECICGMYGNYYWQQIGFLLLFAAAALLIGLLVRRPFMGLNHFVEEKLEETELL